MKTPVEFVREFFGPARTTNDERAIAARDAEHEADKAALRAEVEEERKVSEHLRFGVQTYCDGENEWRAECDALKAERDVERAQANEFLAAKVDAEKERQRLKGELAEARRVVVERGDKLTLALDFIQQVAARDAGCGLAESFLSEDAATPAKQTQGEAASKVLPPCTCGHPHSSHGFYGTGDCFSCGQRGSGSEKCLSYLAADGVSSAIKALCHHAVIDRFDCQDGRRIVAQHCERLEAQVAALAKLVTQLQDGCAKSGARRATETAALAKRVAELEEAQQESTAAWTEAARCLADRLDALSRDWRDLDEHRAAHSKRIDELDAKITLELAEFNARLDALAAATQEDAKAWADTALTLMNRVTTLEIVIKRIDAEHAEMCPQHAGLAPRPEAAAPGHAAHIQPKGGEP